jgi:hypothetical protein
VAVDGSGRVVVAVAVSEWQYQGGRVAGWQGGRVAGWQNGSGWQWVVGWQWMAMVVAMAVVDGSGSGSRWQ